MNELEEKIKKIIDNLSKEELIELKKQVMDIFPKTYSFTISGNFNYERKEEVLKKINTKEEFLKRF